MRNIRPSPVCKDQRAVAFLLAGQNAPVTARPFAEVLPLDLATIKRAQVWFGQGGCLAHGCFTRVAVKIGGDDQAAVGQRQTCVHRGPGAARQDPARRIARAAQPDAVGVGKGGKLAQRKGLAVRRGSTHSAGQAFCLLPDAVHHGAADGIGMTLFKPARVGDGGDAQCQVGRGCAQRIAVGQQGGKRDGLRAGPGFQQHMRKARMQGQGGQLLAVWGDAACVQRAKSGK